MREDKMSLGHLQISQGSTKWDSLASQLEQWALLIMSKTWVKYCSQWDTASLALGKWSGNLVSGMEISSSYRNDHTVHLTDPFPFLAWKLEPNRPWWLQSSVIIILSSGTRQADIMIAVLNQSCHLRFYNFPFGQPSNTHFHLLSYSICWKKKNMSCEHWLPMCGGGHYFAVPLLPSHSSAKGQFAPTVSGT